MRYLIFSIFLLLPNLSLAGGRVRAGLFKGNAAEARHVLPPELVHDESAQSVRLHLLVLSRPAPEAWWSEFKRLGGTVHGYVPDHATIVEACPAALRLISRSTDVIAFEPYHPGFKIEASAFSGPWAEGQTLTVQRLNGKDSAGRPRYTFEALAGHAAHPDVVAALAAQQDVLSIGVELPAELLNDNARWLTQSFEPGNLPWFENGITGYGEVVAVCDSGLTVGCYHEDPSQAIVYDQVDPSAPDSSPSVNPDHRKILAYQFWSSSDTEDSSSVHGTHVSGTVAGDKGPWASSLYPSSDPQDGLAPGARIIMQDVDAGGGTLEVPSDLSGFIQSAYNAGARIHSNSWGSPTSGYTNRSHHVDKAMWDNPELLVVVAAGNSGPDQGTIYAPGTAKNSLTVGASSSSAQEYLGSFSSNGPCADGRRKPDIVASGVGVRSADGLASCDSRWMGGTSMATPVVAASAALVRSYFRKGFYPSGEARAEDGFVPSGALLKCVLLVSGQDLAGGQNVDGPAPDNSQGWGRLQLDKSLPFKGDPIDLLVLSDDDVSSNQDGFPSGATSPDLYQFEVQDPSLPLRVGLAWTDYPGNTGSNPSWVNNLDLLLIDPAGNQYKGNVFSGGFSATGGSHDYRNNVEQCRLEGLAVTAGRWQVKVIPSDVNMGPQPYSLVVVGGLDPPPPCAQSPVFSGVQSALDADDCAATGVELRWGAPTSWGCGDPAVGHFEIYRDDAFLASTADGYETSFLDRSGLEGVTYAYKVLAVNREGIAAGANRIRSATDREAAMPSSAGPLQISDPDPCQATGLVLSWNAPSTWGSGGAGSFTVYRDGEILASGLDASALSYQDASTAVGTVYTYRVAAVNGCAIEGDGSAQLPGEDEASCAGGPVTLKMAKSGASVTLALETGSTGASYHIHCDRSLPLVPTPQNLIATTNQTSWSDPAPPAGLAFYVVVPTPN